MQNVPSPGLSIHPVLKFLIYGMAGMFLLACALPLLAKTLYFHRLNNVQHPSLESQKVLDRWKSEIADFHNLPVHDLTVYEEVGGIEAFVVFPMPSSFRGAQHRVNDSVTVKTGIDRILNAIPEPYSGPTIKPDLLFHTDKSSSPRVGSNIACDSRQKQCCLVYDYGGTGPHF